MSKVDEITQMLTDTVDILTEALKYARADQEESIACLMDCKAGCIEMLNCPNAVPYNDTKQLYKSMLVIKADVEKHKAWIGKIIECAKE
jgi:hypothetical protein